MEKLIQRIAAAERIAVDTEADSLHNYFEKVCLIQLSLTGEHYLVDPLAGLDLAGFLQALAEKPLILHGADYDLRMMRASLGFRPRREVFDTMIGAQLLGIEQIGLAALIERFFDIKIGKEGQKSDWSRRPLSEKQLRYAVNDTRFLERLAQCLEEQLSEQRRTDWHVESCGAMVLATGREHGRDPEEAWRITGSGRMSRRQLAYLRELWRWRDEHARRANVPSFKILVNDQMLELALWAESHSGVPLHQGPKLPRNIDGARLRTVEEAIARAASLPQSSFPEIKRQLRGEPLPGDCTERIKQLRDECARIAKELAIATSTLAPRAALESIARKRPRTVEDITASAGLLRWQAELIQGAVDKVLHSRADQRV
jgi:ribonuclease D